MTAATASLGSTIKFPNRFSAHFHRTADNWCTRPLSDLPAQSAGHSLNRSFGVIAGARVSGAGEELAIGVNDGRGHNFESYRPKDCHRLTQASARACVWICRSVQEKSGGQQS